jgi:hypothetical protein
MWLPEAHALEGTSLLSGAQQVPVQRRLKSLSQSKGPPLVAVLRLFLSPCERGWSVRQRLRTMPARATLAAINQWRHGPFRRCHNGPFARRH